MAGNINYFKLLFCFKKNFIEMYFHTQYIIFQLQTPFAHVIILL